MTVSAVPMLSSPAVVQLAVNIVIEIVTRAAATNRVLMTIVENIDMPRKVKELSSNSIRATAVRIRYRSSHSQRMGPDKRHTESRTGAFLPADEPNVLSVTRCDRSFRPRCDSFVAYEDVAEDHVGDCVIAIVPDEQRWRHSAFT